MGAQVEKQLYAVIAIPEGATDKCFHECGKILIGGIYIDGIPCFPCRESDCPFDNKVLEEMDFEIEWEWGKETCKLRKMSGA
jgi:hypothetical protein